MDGIHHSEVDLQPSLSMDHGLARSQMAEGSGNWQALIYLLLLQQLPHHVINTDRVSLFRLRDLSSILHSSLKFYCPGFALTLTIALLA